MKNKQLLFKILNKIFNILNFRYFLLAKFLAKYFFFTNYNSKELNNYKIDIFIQNSDKVIETPALLHLKYTLDYYKKKFNSFPKKILEFGGGTGENAILLKKIFNEGFDYCVVENETLVKIANNKKLTHCRFLSKIEKDEKYDLIFSSATLQYLDDPYTILNQFEKHCKNLISLARLNCNEEQKVKLQISLYKKNIGYQNIDHKFNNNLAIYPYQELSLKGENIKLIEIEEQIRERDFLDTNRKNSPLKKANDAIVIDTTHLDIDGQVNAILEIINNNN